MARTAVLVALAAMLAACCGSASTPDGPQSCGAYIQPSPFTGGAGGNQSR